MSRIRTAALVGGALALVVGAGTAAATMTDDHITESVRAAAAGQSSNITTGTTEPATPTSTGTDTSTSTTTPTTMPGSAGLSAAAARQIALARVGGGQVREVELETEHGRIEWKVRIIRDGVRHDVRVDAVSGAVTRVDSDDDRGGVRTPTATTVDHGDDDHGDDRGGRGFDDSSGHGSGDDHGGHGSDD